MFTAWLRDRLLLVLLLLVLFVKLFSLNAGWVETYYTFGFYPLVAKTLRTLFGWIPFSLGDAVYVVAFAWLVSKVWKAVKLLRRRELKSRLTITFFQKYLKLALGIYVVFNFFWGLNYNRQGIAKQMELTLRPYTKEELLDLTKALQKRLSWYASVVDSTARLRYDQNGVLFKSGSKAYENARRYYPFLAYASPSVKPSLLTPIGSWFGFTGYYNPFTAEAQLKTDIPVFLKPFVVAHEMAHQLGYAKENEANFVAYLTCKTSENIDFLYSAYFELYRDAVLEYAAMAGKEEFDGLTFNFPPRVTNDVQDLRLYFLRSRNFIEPLMSGAYENYLKLNNQPKGHRTYSEVIAYLIAYMHKFGEEAI